MQIVLGNRSYPEYGVATIPFPIPREEYDHCIKLLAALEIGDAVRRDCQVLEVSGPWLALKRLEDSEVNLDELDYLAKRLDSFCAGEDAQFQAMAEKLDLTDIRDFINLTFGCQQATVITDFSNLEHVGREHYMNLNGGCASTEELDNLDGEETALLLIDSGAGAVTRYGVVYDNGMRLEQLYDGKHLPDYHYEPDMLTVALTSKKEPKNTEHVTWLYLPAAKGQIGRAMLRSGIPDPEDMRFRFEGSGFPAEINAALDFQQESIYELNDLAAAVETLSPAERQKLGAAVQLAQPECAFQIRHLAENLDQFEFAPNVHAPAEYGRYMIQESGHFEYDENLEGFYDYEKYGLQRMEQETGMLTGKGYISYHGALSLEELMMEEPAETYRQGQGFQMGGIA